MTGPVKKCYTEDVNELEKQFHALLALLAADCGAELNEMRIALYDKYLAPYGYDLACQALESLIIERAANDPFPAVGTILARMGKSHTPKTLAVDVTNRIVTAISSKGYNWSDKVQDFEADQKRVLGEIGVAVVKRLGGWRAVHEFVNSNPNHFRPWIRDSVAAVIESQGTNILSLNPPRAQQIEHKS